MQLIIFGNSEIAACAYEYFTHDSDYSVVAFTVDERFCAKQEHFLNLPLIPFERLSTLYNPKNFSAFAAIGSQKLNRLRTEKYLALKQSGFNIASYVSSRAFVWNNVLIGEHAFILENNTLQPYTKIANNVTLWSGNHIGHSTTIKDNCFITSHVVISGCCTIGANSFIGVNSAISENINIGDDNFIGMQCLINISTESNKLFVGEKSRLAEISAHKFCKVPMDVT